MGNLAPHSDGHAVSHFTSLLLFLTFLTWLTLNLQPEFVFLDPHLTSLLLLLFIL